MNTRKEPSLLNLIAPIIYSLKRACIVGFTIASLCLLFSFSASPFPESGVEFSYTSYENMVKEKQQLLGKDSASQSQYEKLVERSEKALNSKTFSVVNKTGVAASGDKHDYFTMAPYFWPNPDTPDKLPYIRKDGEINPESRTSYTDFNEIEGFVNTVKRLGKSYFMTEDKRYADKAIELIKAWFVDPETKMNPHLNYGQGIPGVNDGRCFGIIEFSGFSHVVTTIEILKLGGCLEPELEKDINAWISDYFHWLSTSELGIMESTRANNHAVHYDKQLMGLLWYLGRKDEIKTYLEGTVAARIASQVEPDGRMPRELARTKAFTYSCMNLRAFSNLVSYGKRVDVDLWAFETEDGRSLKRAYEFLADYLKNDRPWDYQQITEGDYYVRFAHDLQSVGKRFDIPEFVEIGTQYLERKEARGEK